MAARIQMSISPESVPDGCLEWPSFLSCFIRLCPAAEGNGCCTFPCCPCASRGWWLPLHVDHWSQWRSRVCLGPLQGWRQAPPGRAPPSFYFFHLASGFGGDISLLGRLILSNTGQKRIRFEAPSRNGV